MKNFIRTILLLLLLIIILPVFSSECFFLSDPENKDISNNNIYLYNNSQSIDLKYLSSDTVTYYIMWPSGEDTIQLKSDSLNIFRITIKPSDLHIGKYWIEVLNKDYKKDLNFIFSINEPINYYLVILNILLGLVFFMMGLKFSSKGLSRISGYRLKEILWNLSDSTLKGTLAGVILTIMLQSSTVFSVMITSFVSDKLIGITGAIAMLAGAAIGTSIIVQIIAFDISFFSIIMIITGFYIYDRIKRFREFGSIILGFGLIFLAIKMMSGAVMPIRDTMEFQNIILFLQNNPIWLFIITALFTFSVHSSAVTVALIMGLFATGHIHYEGIIIMIAAANLGTTFTATMASMKGSNKAKYVSIVNASMKLIVGIVFLVIALKLKEPLACFTEDVRGIANMHMLFNVFFAFIMIGFLPLIKFGSSKIKHHKKVVIDIKMMNESMKKTPNIALGHIYNEIIKMARIAYSMYDKSFDVLKGNDSKLLKKLVKKDDKIDGLEKEITMFLINLSEEELSKDISTKIRSLLFIVDEIEHIGDVVSKNLMVIAEKKIENNYYFSKQGFKDIKMMYEEVKKTFNRTIGLMTMFDNDESEAILKRRKQMLNTLNELHIKHLDRMQKSVKESIETSTLHLDILNDYERINFHSCKICYYLAENKNKFGGQK